jgi:hypothetical protein
MSERRVLIFQSGPEADERLARLLAADPDLERCLIHWTLDDILSCYGEPAPAATSRRGRPCAQSCNVPSRFSTPGERSEAMSRPGSTCPQDLVAAARIEIERVTAASA